MIFFFFSLNSLCTFVKRWGFSILTEKGIKVPGNLWLLNVFTAHCYHSDATARSLCKVWGKHKEPCLDAGLCVTECQSMASGGCACRWGKSTLLLCSVIKQPAVAGCDRQKLSVHSPALRSFVFLCWLELFNCTTVNANSVTHRHFGQCQWDHVYLWSLDSFLSSLTCPSFQFFSLSFLIMERTTMSHNYTFHICSIHIMHNLNSCMSKQGRGFPPPNPSLTVETLSMKCKLIYPLISRCLSNTERAVKLLKSVDSVLILKIHIYLDRIGLYFSNLSFVPIVLSYTMLCRITALI